MFRLFVASCLLASACSGGTGTKDLSRASRPLGLNGADHPTVLLSCWDWTFAYNMFTVEETNRFYYVSIVGSTLVGQDPTNATPFRLTNGFDSHEIGNNFASRFPVITAFAKDKCSWNPETNSISCLAGDRGFPWNENIFLDRVLDHLNQPTRVISSYPAAQLAVEASAQGFTFSRISEYDGEVTKDTLAVSPHADNTGLQCGLDPYDNGNSFLNAHVPDALVRHLEQ